MLNPLKFIKEWASFYARRQFKKSLLEFKKKLNGKQPQNINKKMKRSLPFVGFFIIVFIWEIRFAYIIFFCDSKSHFNSFLLYNSSSFPLFIQNCYLIHDILYLRNVILKNLLDSKQYEAIMVDILFRTTKGANNLLVTLVYFELYKSD